MPIIDGSDFLPHKKRYRNGHYNTFIPYLFGFTPDIQYERVRIDTPDGDFLDVDFSRVGSRRAVVLCHGLEGSSDSGYVKLFTDYFNRKDWDAVALNYRGCSGEMNRKLQMYNSGSSHDLYEVIEHISPAYDEILLIGFSLGGNISLKYLGESAHPVNPKVSKAIAVSTPLNLEDASLQLLKWDNILYQWKFLMSLSGKIIQKKRQFPDEISLKPLLKTTNLYKFDNHYTAPIGGYESAKDYYDQNQSINWIDKVEIPTLVLNAKDDPFLGPKSYPEELVKDLESVFLCTPEFGGHVGFAYGRNDREWLFDKVDAFITDRVPA